MSPPDTPPAPPTHSFGLRVWHWLDAAVILGLLGTFLLRKTVLSWRTNAAYIERTLQDAGIVVTPEVARSIAVGLRDRMWEWHHFLGFVLTGLLLLRIAVAVSRRGERPVANALRAARTWMAAHTGERLAAAHEAIVNAGYVVFYGCVTLMVITGLLLYFDAGGGPVKALHEWVAWFFVLFGAGHLVGVVVAELRGSPGIVSRMIHGRRR